MDDAQVSKKMPLPPAMRGQGRKPLPEDERTKTHGVRLTPGRIEKFKELGGNKWLAQQIDKEHTKLKRKPTSSA